MTQTAYVKSGSQGWIEVTILESSEERYRVKVEEGKHKGAIVWVPANYLQLSG